MAEILKLKDMLKIANIPFKEKDLDGTIQLISTSEYSEWDVVCHYGSYGGECGLLELWFHDGEPTGWLTAKQAFNLIKKDKQNHV